MGVFEKKDFKVGFILIICVMFIIMVVLLGFYVKYGFNVEVVKIVGWVVICDKIINKEYDVVYMLVLMLIVILLGFGVNVILFVVFVIENING